MSVIEKLARLFAWLIMGTLGLAILFYLTLLAINWRDEPYICEVIYQDLFSGHGSMTKERTIHLGNSPVPHSRLEDDSAELVGKELVFIAPVVRRYKSEANLPLGSSLALVHLATEDDKLGSALRNASADLMSITRAQRIEVGKVLPDDLLRLESIGTACVAIQP